MQRKPQGSFGVRVSGRRNSLFPPDQAIRGGCATGQCLSQLSAFVPTWPFPQLDTATSKNLREIIIFIIDLVLNQDAVHFLTCYWNFLLLTSCLVIPWIRRQWSMCFGTKPWSSLQMCLLLPPSSNIKLHPVQLLRTYLRTNQQRLAVVPETGK